MQEDGFLMSMPFFVGTVQQSQSNHDIVSVMIFADSILDFLPMKEDASEEELLQGPEKDTEKPREILLRMGYSEEEAARLTEEIVRYDDPYHNTEETEEEINWPDRPMVSLQEIRDLCFPLYAQLAGAGLLKENAETEPLYEVDRQDIMNFQKWFRNENLDTLKAIIVLSLYDDAANYLDQASRNEESSYSFYDDPETALYVQLKETAGIALDQAYLSKFTSMERWEKTLELFDELKEAMRARIEKNAWMDDATKKKSLEKLDQIGIIKLEAPRRTF